MFIHLFLPVLFCQPCFYLSFYPITWFPTPICSPVSYCQWPHQLPSSSTSTVSLPLFQILYHVIIFQWLVNCPLLILGFISICQLFLPVTRFQLLPALLYFKLSPTCSFKTSESRSFAFDSFLFLNWVVHCFYCTCPWSPETRICIWRPLCGLV